MSRFPLFFLLSLTVTGLRAQNLDALRAIFFPPTPPVYGAVVSEVVPRPTLFNSRLLLAPVDLADYVNEHFYPMLGSRLFGENGLGKKLEARVEAYRARRNSLLNDLLDLLTSLNLADRLARERELRAFAAIQTPQIVALEEEAEQLRDMLLRGALFSHHVDWNANRPWRLGVTRFRSPAMEKDAEFQVVRAAAFYQPGLLPQQRGLLRELAIDLHAIAKAARGPAKPVNFNPAAMFFGPETALIVLSANLPPELRDKLAIYNRDKLALKTELRTAIITHDNDPASARGKVFAVLAETHWPRLRALETLAEEIRGDFAALGDPPPPKLPPIPAELRLRIETYDEDRRAFLRDLQEHINKAPPVVAAEFPRNGTPEERAEWAREMRTRRLARPREASAEFMRDHADRAQELRTRYLDIAADLGEAARAIIDPKTGAPVSPESLLRELSLVNQRFAAIGREEAMYENYKTAMFQTGLSPEQRRLLFGAALVNLCQPLPPGELLPTLPFPLPSP
ncbi:MAG: hypothetical protein ABIZ49_02925 [Opitutaceae bacterium]